MLSYFILFVGRKGRAMKKKIAAVTILFLLAGLTACNNQKNGSGSELPSGAVSGYLTGNAAQYVTFGNYDGLKVEKSIYPVTDEDVDAEIDSRLDTDTTFASTAEGAQTGDQVNIDATIVNGETESTLCSDYELLLGNWEFGDVFDENLEGHRAGETLTFSITYDETAPTQEWTGRTICFRVRINDVKAPRYQELDDSYLKKLGYDSEDDYREAVRTELEDISNLNSEDSMYTDLFEQAYAGASFDGYPDDLYRKAQKYVQAGYDTLSEEYGTEADADDMQADILSYINRWLFISAYCEEKNLILTEDYLETYEEREVNAYNYGSVDEYENYTGKDTIVQDAYVYMIGKDLSENAKISEVTYDYTDEFLGVLSDDELETDAVLSTGDDVIYVDIEPDTE